MAKVLTEEEKAAKRDRANALRRARYAANPEKFRKLDREYIARRKLRDPGADTARYKKRNPERMKERQLAWRKANRAKLAEKARKYRAENKEICAAQAKRRKERDSEALKQYQREHYQKNKEKKKAQSRANHNKLKQKKEAIKLFEQQLLNVLQNGNLELDKL
jgi:hypothetical protein